MQEMQVWSLGWEDSLGMEMATRLLPGKSYGQRNLAGYCSPWGHKIVRHDLVTKQQQQGKYASDSKGLVWKKQV